jgi:hypothetical protein
MSRGGATIIYTSGYVPSREQVSKLLPEEIQEMSVMLKKYFCFLLFRNYTQPKD